MNGKVSFGEAIKLFFKNYTNFSGRSSRSEYWWVMLFNMIISAIFTIITIPVLTGLWSLVTLIPGLALAIRRLHDVGKSGWFLLIGLIPLVGVIILLVQYLKESEPANNWGPAPGQDR